MMIKTNKNIVKLKVGIALLVTVCALFYGCKEKYLPEIKETNLNYLVVEGLINTGADSTTFTISRTFKLDKKAVVAPEKDAFVQVESEAGAIYILPALVKTGNYGRPSLNLDPTKKHRLRIRTKDNKEYLSVFVESNASPPIDNIKFDFKNSNLNIYANTHDPAGKSRYYRYSYIETWQYQAPLYSYLKIANHKMVVRDYPKEDILNCWHLKESGNIVLGSTINLTEDRLTDVLLNSVQSGSERLSLKYSILVKQTVLTKEGFAFWETLRKNTEQVGNIFDSQPSQLFGNIRSTTNPQEVVIGFISAGTVTEKRLTIEYIEFPREWESYKQSSTCEEAEESFYFRNMVVGGNEVEVYLLAPSPPQYTPTVEIGPPAGPVIGYKATRRLECVDCRLQGGTNVKPLYW